MQDSEFKRYSNSAVSNGQAVKYALTGLFGVNLMLLGYYVL